VSAHPSAPRLGACLVACTLASAPVAAAQRPDTTTIAYDVGAVHVIQRITPFATLVSANIYLLGGTQQLTPATAGIELLTLDAAARGTGHYPAAASAIAFQRTGSLPRLQVNTDWTAYGFTALPSQFDSTWAVVADRLVAPTLDSSSIATSAAKLRLAARRRRDNPETLIRAIADSVVFAGHPYALDPSGTDESLGTITAAQVRQYAANQFVASRLLVVVVGPIDRAHVEPAISATLATLPRGTYTWTPPPPLPKHDRSTLTTVTRPFTTNYLLAYFSGPPASSGDYTTFVMATTLVGGQLAQAGARENFRSQSEPTLTYHLGATATTSAIAHGSILGMADSPNLIVPIIRSHLGGGFGGTLNIWDRWRDEYLTGYNMLRESSTRQADMLARAQILHGDYRQQGAEVRAIEHTDPGQVAAAARFYMRNLQFIYVGDPHDLDPNEFEAF
jgi:zinc protease